RGVETVGCPKPTGSMRSQTQASLPSCAATSETSLSRVGSAIALKILANTFASSTLSGSPVSVEQQAAGAGSVCSVITLPLCPHIDSCRYEVVGFISTTIDA